MRRVITFCLFIISFLPAHAQSGAKISGRLTDTARTPIVSATIVLVNSADSLPVKTTVTVSDGRFMITDAGIGAYRVWITYIGYLKYKSNTLTISQAGQAIDLGQITLQKATATQLKEVTISSKRPFVEHKIDRTVVNVDALATNAGISALDVLEKSPGILVDPNGSISLEGKPGTVVYIDDKKSYLSGADLAAYLQSLG